MSARCGRSTRRGTADASGTREAVVVGVALVTLALLAAFVLSTPALAQDSSPPTFGNGTAINATAFEFVIEDDAGVDEGTVTEGDFSFSNGNVDAITVTESGNDSVVTVRLADSIRENDVTVSLADGGVVRDDAGNNMTEGNVTVTGMDGYDPYLQEYELTWLSDSRLQIVFYADERIYNTSVVVDGPETTTYGPENFTETDTPAAHEYRYHTNHTFRTEGEYEVTLEWIADAADNFGLYHADRTAVYDVTRPQARISGPASATLGQTMAFDASESTDNQGVETYEWAVDGNVSGTNETFGHTFNTSGSHEVSLTVTDSRNNSDTAVTNVEVLDVSTTRDVSITERNGTGVDVTIGPNRSKQRVLVERSASLATNGSVTLDSLTLSVPTNETATLTTAADAEPPTDFAVADQTGFGTFAVDHEGADVSDVTFRFTVNRTVIERADASPDGVSLYREAGGDWARLPALRVSGNDTHLEYRATSPGFSRFVVAGSNTTGDEDAVRNEGDSAGDGGTSGENDADESAGNQPSFAIADATLLTRNVSAGNPVVARATVVNDGNATGTYVAGLAVNDSVVATSAVTVPAGEQRDVTVAGPVQTGGLATMNGTHLGWVTVGGGAVASDGGGGFSVPNPLTLWPGGLFGRALGAIFWLVVVVYAILKSLAIYLGY